MKKHKVDVHAGWGRLVSPNASSSRTTAGDVPPDEKHPHPTGSSLATALLKADGERILNSDHILKSTSSEVAPRSSGRGPSGRSSRRASPATERRRSSSSPAALLPARTRRSRRRSRSRSGRRASSHTRTGVESATPNADGTVTVGRQGAGRRGPVVDGWRRSSPGRTAPVTQASASRPPAWGRRTATSSSTGFSGRTVPAYTPSATSPRRLAAHVASPEESSRPRPSRATRRSGNPDRFRCTYCEPDGGVESA